MKENIKNLLLSIETIEKIYNSSTSVKLKCELITKYHIDKIILSLINLGINFRISYSVDKNMFFDRDGDYDNYFLLEKQEYLDLYFEELQKLQKELKTLFYEIL